MDVPLPLGVPEPPPGPDKGGPHAHRHQGRHQDQPDQPDHVERVHVDQGTAETHGEQLIRIRARLLEIITFVSIANCVM